MRTPDFGGGGQYPKRDARSRDTMGAVRPCAVIDFAQARARRAQAKVRAALRLVSEKEARAYLRLVPIPTDEDLARIVAATPEEDRR